MCAATLVRHGGGAAAAAVASTCPRVDLRRHAAVQAAPNAAAPRMRIRLAAHPPEEGGRGGGGGGAPTQPQSQPPGPSAQQQQKQPPTAHGKPHSTIHTHPSHLHEKHPKPQPQHTPTPPQQQQQQQQGGLPRPPSSYSGGPHAGASPQSAAAADAAAEATLAEAIAAAAAEHQYGTEGQRQQPLQQAPQQAPQRQPAVASPSKDSTSSGSTGVGGARVAEAEAPKAPLSAAAAGAAGPSSAGHGIDRLRTQPHEFSCSEPSTRGGTIVVALDDTEDSSTAVEWVAKNMYIPGADDLRVVHVVCDPQSLHWQTSIGTSASGRAISMDSLDLGLSPAPVGGSFGGMEMNLENYMKRLNTAAEAVVARRCEPLRKMGLQFQAHLPSLPTARSAAGIAEKLLEAAREADAKLLVVASHGPGALAEYGSVSRFCYQHSTVPLLLVPSPDTTTTAAAAGTAPSRAAAAAAASTVEAPEQAPPAPPSASASAIGSQILLVVNHLEELANVWQWVADNCARKGDSVSIWHVAGPSLSGMPSLPTAIANQMRRRGIADVSYRQLYSSTGDPLDMGEQVCAQAAGNPAIKLVVLLNYSRRGLIQEALHGSMASHLSRHCPKPLLLLQLPE